MIKYRDDLTMDEDTLQEIAKITGGAYFRATDTRALEEISDAHRPVGEDPGARRAPPSCPSPCSAGRWGSPCSPCSALGLFPEGRKRFVCGGPPVPEAGFHFAQPAWFWGLLAMIPVALWLGRSAARAARGPIHRYADPHLLPHLTGTRDAGDPASAGGASCTGPCCGPCCCSAMAGPRWDATDVRLFHPGNNLLMLLDISRSMQVDDVAPSRLGRARQEIQDLIMHEPRGAPRAHRLRLRAPCDLAQSPRTPSPS